MYLILAIPVVTHDFLEKIRVVPMEEKHGMILSSLNLEDCTKPPKISWLHHPIPLMVPYTCT